MELPAAAAAAALPFNQTDFTPAKPARGALPLDAPRNVALLAVIVAATPFFPVDSAKARQPVTTRSPDVPFNQNLFKNPVPFNQFDWSKPQRVPKAPFDLSVSLNPNTFKNPIPFNQVDWEKPRRAPTQPPAACYNSVLYTVTVQATPFNQMDWSSPRRLNALPLPPDALNINLFTNPFPFNQSDWSKSVDIPRAPWVPTDPLNINLFTNPLPFSQFDWSKPLRVPQARTSPDQALNLNLFTNPIPFFQTDWSPAETFRRTPAQDAPYNAALYTVTVVAAPFVQTDWTPSQRVKTAAPLADTAFNPNLFTNPVPFATTAIVAPFRAPAAVLDQQPLNLNLYGIVTASLPFNQTDWAKGAFPHYLPQPATGINPNIFTNPLPFAQTDWSAPVRLRAAIDAPQPLNLNLYGIVTVQVPFNQTDWPKPAPRRAAPLADLPLNINLFTNPMPFAQFDWSRPAPRQWRLADFQPLNIALLTGAALTPMPFSQYDWTPARQPRARLSPDIPNFALLVSVAPSAPPVVHNLHFHATMGRLKSF